MRAGFLPLLLGSIAAKRRILGIWEYTKPTDNTEAAQLEWGARIQTSGTNFNGNLSEQGISRTFVCVGCGSFKIHKINCDIQNKAHMREAFIT